MASLSEQLRGIVNQARENAGQQAGLGLAGNQMQMNQAQQQMAQQPLRSTKAQTQQLAGAMTQANQQVNLAAQQAQFPSIAAGAQNMLAGTHAAQQQTLGNQKMLDELQIAELQRNGALRQNSAKLSQAKRMNDLEINSQKRLLSAKLDYDSSISFLTNKQRQDLAELGNYVKQSMFDQRLMFEKSEAGRKFSNDRQLADYAVLSAQSQQQLEARFQHMKQAAEKEIYALQVAHDVITSRMQFEFERAEKTKDYDMYKALAARKQALEEKQRRKQARGAAITNIMMGAVQMGVGLVVAGGSLGTASPIGTSIFASGAATAAGGAATYK